MDGSGSADASERRNQSVDWCYASGRRSSVALTSAADAAAAAAAAAEIAHLDELSLHDDSDLHSTSASFRRLDSDAYM